MGGRIHALAQQLTGKTTIEECSLDEIQNIATRYPYYAPAQFLLLQKLRQTNSSGEAEKQYQKGVLFFHNPLQFEHFISSDKFLTESEVIAPIDQEVEEQELSTDTLEAQEITTLSTDDIAETSFTESRDETALQEQTEQGLIEESTNNHEEEFEAIKPVEVIEDLSVLPTVETDVVHGETETTSKETQLPDTILPPTPVTASTDLTFEPFHTVDYFASQGIKITQDEVPKDKLGKQLKSFTEWLKTMKRLPAAQIEVVVESSAEKKIESMANHSVTESNVVTEAMAEVWLKQGNKVKALDIYNKLSLLNPSKKAYFAAKIENLKPS